jgi:transcriptional regulator with XRE-family HTH domain
MTELRGGARDHDAICFGLIVKRLRMQRGWTIQQVASVVGIHRTHLGVIERGGNSPTLRTLIALSHALGADPTDVLREILQNREQFRKRA